MTGSPEKRLSRALFSRLQYYLGWLDELGHRLSGVTSSQRRFVLSSAPSMSGEEVILSDRKVIQHTMFMYAVSVFSARLMRADGHINRKEHQAFVALFAIQDLSQRKLRSLLVAASKDTAPLEQYIHQLAEICKGNKGLQKQLLLRMSRVALSDEPLSAEEFDMLWRLGKAFGLSRKTLAEWVDQADGPTEGSPYHLLKLSENASAEVIQKAYHERIRYCHPDRWEQKQEYRELYQLAHTKSAAINQAYSLLTEWQCKEGNPSV